jgi:hypothetical protein
MGVIYLIRLSVLWILIGINADLDPAFLKLLCGSGNQAAEPMRTHADADPDPGQTFLGLPLLKAFLEFWSIPGSRRAKSMRIWIHNTDCSKGERALLSKERKEKCKFFNQIRNIV